MPLGAITQLKADPKSTSECAIGYFVINIDNHFSNPVGSFVYHKLKAATKSSADVV
ncbi:MAG: hypothetical protein P8H39_14300 [Thalassotalea sp.]|nr:hypothetical protein [Thalassotalea sp.]